jgi:DNA-binding response OmpR family regulator
VDEDEDIGEGRKQSFLAADSATINNYSYEKTSKRRILIIDDEPDLTFVFKTGLEDNGFVVDTFNDPQQAIANFKADLYDLLLIDIGIPNMNGFEFYKELRKIDDKVKVCFLTAFEVNYINLKSKYNNLPDPNCVISKPISTDDLVKRVNQII